MRLIYESFEIIIKIEISQEITARKDMILLKRNSSGILHNLGGRERERTGVNIIVIWRSIADIDIVYCCRHD